MDTLGPLIFMATVVPFSVLFLVNSIRIVPENHRCVMFRLGKYFRVYGPGIFFIIPFFDNTISIDLREQVRTLEALIDTQDNTHLVAHLTWRYQVIDPEKSILEVPNLDIAIRTTITTILRSVIGVLSYGDVLLGRQQVQAEIEKKLRKISANWGVEIISLELSEVRKNT